MLCRSRRNQTHSTGILAKFGPLGLVLGSSKDFGQALEGSGGLFEAPGRVSGRLLLDASVGFA